MGGFRKLARDTALLTLSALLMRCVGLVYQVWLAGRIGAPGVGLWQLVTSVNVLTATVAISGIRFTATRLLSEEFGKPGGGNAAGAVARCLLYAAVSGSAACLLTYCTAERIGFLWLGDARTVRCLRLLAFTLPMISLSCVLNGFFIARGKAWKSAAAQVAEQVVNVCCVMLLLRGVDGRDMERCCVAIARGNLLADAVSLLLVLGCFLTELPTLRSGGARSGLTGRMLGIAVPLAVSAYARTGLTTLENILIPRKLRSSGLSAEGALGGYGIIHGMVFPVITFPSCLLVALAELTVPELTAAQVRGDAAYIRKAVSELLRMTALFSAAAALILYLASDAVGQYVYHNAEVGRYVRLLSPLVPLMYLDIVTDGCLKGLGQMLWSMSLNVCESLAGVALVVALLPRYALRGYVLVLFFCECFNFALSYARLKKLVGFSLFPRKTKHGSAYR